MLATCDFRNLILLRQVGRRTFLPRGVQVTGQSILWLIAGLVEEPEVGPGGGVILVELYRADVGLDGVVRLVLLLVEDPDGTPGVSVGFQPVHRTAVRQKRLVNLSDRGVAAAKQVKALDALRVALDGLLQVGDGHLHPLVLVRIKALHAMVHPSQLSVHVGLHAAWQLLLQQLLVQALGRLRLALNLPNVGNVEPQLQLAEGARGDVHRRHVEVFQAPLELVIHLRDEAQPDVDVAGARKPRVRVQDLPEGALRQLERVVVEVDEAQPVQEVGLFPALLVQLEILLVGAQALAVVFQKQVKVAELAVELRIHVEVHLMNLAVVVVVLRFQGRLSLPLTAPDDEPLQILDGLDDQLLFSSVLLVVEPHEAKVRAVQFGNDLQFLGGQRHPVRKIGRLRRLRIHDCKLGCKICFYSFP